MLVNLLIALLLSLSSCERQGHEKSDITEIETTLTQYEKAFNQNDSKALAALWTENGALVVPEAGIFLEGREEIEDRFAAFFKKHPNAHLEMKSKSLNFPPKRGAEETGTAVFTKDGKAFKEIAFKVFYEKVDGKWLISELREVRFSGPPEPSKHLTALDWILGDWVDEDEDASITSSYQWDRYHNFIIHKFTVTVEGSFEIEGRELIGWDPIEKRIRSWIFDSDGGFGSGSWKQEDNKWIVETSFTLADGRRASSIIIFTVIDHDKYVWQSTGRSVGGELLPDIEPVNVVRKKQ